ncbi:MAG: sodium:solute symporter family transporter [Planctomycetota bacterium]
MALTIGAGLGPLAEPSGPELGGGFTGLDWLIVGLALVSITVIGERLTGKQESLRDFYLGGKSLPWFAVSASIIATEISAVTFFAVPSMVWRDGGSLLYLQVGLFSALVARLVVATVLVPAYYEREVYSPYEFMGNRLGPAVRRMTTGLFMIGGALAQASRVYITAVVIEVLAQEELAAAARLVGLSPLACAILAIALVALLWTWIGGMATVVWTDALLFLLFVGGMAGMLIVLHLGVGGGLAESWQLAMESGRLQLVDTEFAFTRPYTLWAVLFAASWGLIGPYGTDQLIVQRLLCCRSKRDAQFAMIGSYAAVIVIALAFLVGVGLHGYYLEHPMSDAGLALVVETPERILPVFVREELPAGVRGLVLAAAFAAAISSLDSILAALGQASQATLWPLLRRVVGRPAQTADEGSIRAGRAFVICWAVALAGLAMVMPAIEAQYDDLLGLALGMSGLVGGPLLAGFVLSWLPGERGAGGYLWSAPLGLLTVLFGIWHGDAAYAASWWVVGTFIGLWLFLGLPRRRQPHGSIQTLWLAFTLFLLTRLAEVGDFDDGKSIAWPWYVPVGSSMTLLYAYLLDRPSSSVAR